MLMRARKATVSSCLLVVLACLPFAAPAAGSPGIDLRSPDSVRAADDALASASRNKASRNKARRNKAQRRQALRRSALRRKARARARRRAWARQAAHPVVVADTVDLCAKAGTATMPDGVTVPIWGFAIKPTGVACGDPAVVAHIPGPSLEVAAGQPVTVNVHNALGHNVAAVFPGLPIPQDGVGAPSGGTASYTFTPSEPGTYVYEGGPSIRNAPMGLYGALVVRPAGGGQAYNVTGTAFEREAVLVLSEIDPRLNNDPSGFSMRTYKPSYRLINGAAHPDAAPIGAGAGQRLALRYVNAGLEHHTMAIHGLRQRVVAREAIPLRFPVDAVAETIPSGQTLDAITTVPAGAALGRRFPLLSRQLRLTNGMLTFVTVDG